MATIEFQKKSFCSIYSKEIFFIVRKNKSDKKPKLTLFTDFNIYSFFFDSNFRISFYSSSDKYLENPPLNMDNK